MQKRDIFWICVLVAVIGVYIYLHRPQPQDIQIATTIRAVPRRRGSATTFPVYVSLDKFYKINDLRVIPAEKSSDGVVHEMWHMEAKTGSEPIKLFQYGENLQGMQPHFKGLKAEPLVPGERYIMEITAGKVKGTSKPFTTQLLP